MKFALISDIHIRTLSMHNQYRIIFTELYDKLRKRCPDYIIIGGDLFHNKVNISPESVLLASEFLKNLADIADTYIILGNHDFLIKNLDRLDSITPVVKILNHPRLNFIKYSKQIELEGNFVLDILSIFDQENWSNTVNEDKINIGLFHGMVKGSVTDTGWIVDTGAIELDILSRYHYVFLGDIHRYQILDEAGHIRYPGSLIQNNFSEDIKKGFLFWDIKDKDNFSCDFIEIFNPSPFITIELDENGLISEELDVPKESKIRIISKSDISYESSRKVIQEVTLKFNPESIVFLKKDIIKKDIFSFVFNENQAEDLRSLEVQERIVRDYLSSYNIADVVLNKVLELNKKYKVVIDNKEDIKRNVFWKIKSLEWSNLFNYGEENKIIFSNLKGIVGIFGPSYSGKSSIVEVLLYILFNSCSKNVRKNYNIINQDKEFGKGIVELDVNGKTYFIERESEKYDKKTRDGVLREARTKVNFYSKNADDSIENYNGSERNDTDNVIRRIFGTIDDFLLTNMSSQFDFLSFINAGSTRRKEILIRFLDLEVFEQKYRMAKDDSDSIRALLRRVENENYDVEIDKISVLLDNNNSILEEKKNKQKRLKELIGQCHNDVLLIDEKIKLLPFSANDYKLIKNQLYEKENKCLLIKKDNIAIEKEIQDSEKKYIDLNQFIEKDFDVDVYRKRKDVLLEKNAILKNLKENIRYKKNILSLNVEKTLLLVDIPCKDQYPDCKFIKDAYDSKHEVNKLNSEILEFESKKSELESQFDVSEVNKVEGYIQKYMQLIDRRNRLSLKMDDLKSKFHRNDVLILSNENDLELLRKEIDEYEKHLDIVDNFDNMQNEKEKKLCEYKKLEAELSVCGEKILKLYKERGSLEEKHESLILEKQKMSLLAEEYTIYELFQKVFCKSGVAFDIVKNKLPFINNEISKVLVNIVPFEIFLESNDDKLDIFIQHEGSESRPLELGSGAEKALAALAIRCAFIKVCNLPKCSILILDEVGSGFDASVMEGFMKTLELLKEEFETIILISHLDVLKDVVENEIVITHKDGYANVNQLN